MASIPSYAAIPRAAAEQVSAANTARDGTGTVVTLFTAGASGSRIDDIDIVAAATTTAGVVRLFLHNGTGYRLLREILVSAITPSTTVEVFSARLRDLALILPTGWSLRASTHIAETFNVMVTRAGDF